MNGKKRQRSNSTDNCDNHNGEIEKSQRTSDSETSFEDLSNELIYEIFEYLDVYHIYQGFFNLNTRYQNLCTHVNLSIEMNISSLPKTTFQNYYNQFILQHKHQIKSLHLSDIFIMDFFTSLFENISKCFQLRSLFLQRMESTCLEHLLADLSSLPNLSSLSIRVGYGSHKMTIYNQIFQLSTLKYCKISFETNVPLGSVSLSSNISNSIEHLVIIDNADLDEVKIILSCIPKIRRLSITYRHEYCLTEAVIFLMILNNSTHISIAGNLPSNKESIKEFLKNYSRNIKVLHVSSAHYSTHFDTWEQSILPYIRHLHVVDVQQTTSGLCDDTRHIYHSIYDPYISSLPQIRQRCFSHVPMSEEYLHEIFCSLRPHRKNYFKFSEESHTAKCKCYDKACRDLVQHISIEDINLFNKSSKYLPHVTELTFSKKCIVGHDEQLIDSLHRTVLLTRLTTLNMNNIYSELGILINLLRFTPNIHTLTWVHLRDTPNDLLSIQESETFRFVSKQNQIKKIIITHEYTKKMMEVLVNLCPRVQFISFGNSCRSLDATVYYLLSEIKEATRYLFALCIFRASPKWIEEWENLIKSREVFDDYSTKYVDGKYYLWWNNDC
ncbi:hypothetical protein I4U23_004900 [Adineta vaga]|nr:hypothetical protein I4U23_004900 [Adineta vaga]